MEEHSDSQQVQILLRNMLSEKPPFVLLHRIRVMIDKELDSYLQRKCQITLPQFHTLAFLYHSMLQGKRAPLSELAEILMVTKGNVTGLIDRLEAQKYVRRTRCKSDRRQVLVEITPEGSAKLESSILHHKNFMQNIMGSILTTEEKMQFHGLLKKINEKLPSALSEIKTKLKASEQYTG
ncbi:MAG: MarR family winged helix-turn-helix transcriptional regulator [Candidatus Jordarchaeum sp.]|uniref:MarR family winged helix-turn-helix transcriptional regulator n=1 Tax=Candidatus Jordarchaeum sp. TaxID=2823881 RepID=UPI00404AC7F4